ncbi:hypothetical protein CNR22_11395 [Sphingobacteriaceae bacterium]|nr:hypothetical protein CNR22_11395 [Sphingobacteriaceae bacterium]
MIEDIKYKGYWKLPTDSDYKVSGELSFTKETGIQLALLGSLTGKHSGRQNYKAIQGFTSDGKLITVFDCNGASGHSNPGFTTSSFRGEFMFVGAHYSKLEDLIIENTAIHFLLLDQWVDIHGIEITELEYKPYRVQTTYTHPPSISLYSDDEKEILIWFSSTNPLMGDILDITIAQKIYININYKSPTTVKVILTDIQKFRNFLSFGLSRTIVPTEIKLYPKAGEHGSQFIYKESYYPKINNAKEHIFDYTTLFKYLHIQKNAHEVVERWFQKYEILRPVFDRYFDCIYNPTLYEVNQFLNLMFAIETYHRRTTVSHSFPVEKFEELKNTLAVALPQGKEYSEWFKNKFSYANEVSLRQRLKDVFKEFKEVLDELESKPKEFISKIVQTRNYYVHYDESSKSGIVTEEEFESVNSTLVIILQLVLLKELGFNMEDSKAAVKRSLPNWHRFKH